MEKSPKRSRFEGKITRSFGNVIRSFGNVIRSFGNAPFLGALKINELQRRFLLNIKHLIRWLIACVRAYTHTRAIKPTSWAEECVKRNAGFAPAFLFIVVFPNE